MKKARQIAAIIGVVILLGMYAVTMIAAFGKSETARALFLGSLACTILVPVLLYALLLAAKVVKPDKSPVIDTVIFDVGGVLVDFPWIRYPYMIDISDEAREYIMENVIHGSIWAECDLGNESFETLVQKFIALGPQYEAEIRELIETMYTCISVQPFTKKWLMSLANSGYRVYILSNWSEHAYEKCTENGVLDFIRYADGCVWSFQVHQRKPDTAIYRTLLAEYKIDPARAVFIDDNEENIEAAKRCGIGGILFESFEKTIARLEDLGVRVKM